MRYVGFIPSLHFPPFFNHNCCLGYRLCKKELSKLVEAELLVGVNVDVGNALGNDES
jgi:hypothetical protein